MEFIKTDKPQPQVGGRGERKTGSWRINKGKIRRQKLSWRSESEGMKKKVKNTWFVASSRVDVNVKWKKFCKETNKGSSGEEARAMGEKIM